MAKGQDSKKAVKKKSEKTMKEKRKEKKEKKASKIQTYGPSVSMLSL